MKSKRMKRFEELGLIGCINKMEISESLSDKTCEERRKILLEHIDYLSDKYKTIDNVYYILLELVPPFIESYSNLKGLKKDTVLEDFICYLRIKMDSKIDTDLVGKT